MANTNSDNAFHTPISRLYIDIRPYAPISATRHLNPPKKDDDNLPLLHTLPREIREAITKYVRKPDRFMSLASALLKYLFIHKTARIPWSQVEVQRTPNPHSRPYWAPPVDWSGRGFEGLEFNVSHQAGMVVLVGCKTPNRPRDARINDQDKISLRSPAVMNPDPLPLPKREHETDRDGPEDIRIGVDIACTWEPPRTPDLSTQEKLEEWVEVFDEMFSLQEQHDMKYAPVPGIVGMNDSEQKIRRFYTYWGLKEAYIKMVGEGLLASWLRELEFRDVAVPGKPEKGAKDQWMVMPDEELSQLAVFFKDKDISRTMHTTLEAFEDTFLVATMTRGVAEQDQSKGRWTKVDLFGDIELCATEKCRCLA